MLTAKPQIVYSGGSKPAKPENAHYCCAVPVTFLHHAMHCCKK